MKIIISGQHIEDFSKFEQYARKKAEKLSKFHSKIEKITIRLIAKKSHRGQEQDYICEFDLDIPGHNLEISDYERSMDKAIDKAIERAKRTLIKSKEKQISKQHKRGILNKLKNRFF